MATFGINDIFKPLDTLISTAQQNVINSGISGKGTTAPDTTAAAMAALQAQAKIDAATAAASAAAAKQNMAGDSRAVLTGLLTSYGFDSGQANSMLQQIVPLLGKYDASTITSAFLPQLPEYKERFKANDARIKAGLSALSPPEYFALESGYKKALDMYKLPVGFYDDPKNDFASWIANDVSAEEIAGRAKTAFDWANSADSETKAALKNYYGIDESSIAAYALDRQRALPLLEKQYKTTQLGAEALRQNLDVGRQFTEGLVDKNISQQEARQAFSGTAQTKEAFGKLASMEGQDLNTGEIISAQLDLNADATKKVSGLASRERARFSGRAAGEQSLGQNLSGSF